MANLSPSDGIMWYVVFLYSTVCHEAGHAWSAYKLGDRTAYDGGQVSLDPIPHIKREPVGMVVVPVLSFLMGGWIMGWASAPYDPTWAIRHPKRAAWMALAGPAANLVLLLAAALLIRSGLELGIFIPPDFIRSSHLAEAAHGSRLVELLTAVLSIVFSMNLLLFTFNLLPLPPFDGSNLPLFFLKGRAAEKYREIIWNPTFKIVGLLIAFRAFGKIFPVIQSTAIELLYPGLYS